VTFDHRAVRDGAPPALHITVLSAKPPSTITTTEKKRSYRDRYAILDDRDVRRVMHGRAPV
jgi:hypothetical protein